MNYETGEYEMVCIWTPQLQGEDNGASEKIQPYNHSEVQTPERVYKNNRLFKRLFELGDLVEGIRTMFGNIGKFVYIPELRQGS